MKKNIFSIKFLIVAGVLQFVFYVLASFNFDSDLVTLIVNFFNRFFFMLVFNVHVIIDLIYLTKETRKRKAPSEVLLNLYYLKFHFYIWYPLRIIGISYGIFLAYYVGLFSMDLLFLTFIYVSYLIKTIRELQVIKVYDRGLLVKGRFILWSNIKEAYIKGNRLYVDNTYTVNSDFKFPMISEIDMLKDEINYRKKSVVLEEEQSDSWYLDQLIANERV